MNDSENRFDCEEDELQEQIGALGLFVDLSKFMPPESHLHYKSIAQLQVITLKTVDRDLRVQITLPDKSFEWFVKVLTVKGKLLTSGRVGHSGRSEEELKHEMRTEILMFIETVSKCKTRVNHKTVQFLDGQNWKDFEIVWTCRKATFFKWLISFLKN